VTPAPPPCPACSGSDVVAIGAQWVCCTCRHEWDAKLGERLDADDLRGAFAESSLKFPGQAIAGVRHPAIASLDRALAGLTEQRRRNRAARIQHAIETIEEIEAVIAQNIEHGWDRTHVTDPAKFAARERECSPERAIDALDRIVRRIEAFERMWQEFGDRSPLSLWRDPWEIGGRWLADDLDRLGHVREFLQIARTLLGVVPSGGSNPSPGVGA
jgi:hypothetical protein